VEDESETDEEQPESVPEERISLHEQRLTAVASVLKERGARRVLDLGCGEAKLLRRLVKEPAFSEVVGLDVSHRALAIAREKLDRLPEQVRDRARLLHGSLTYRDRRLCGFDAAAVVEVIEHLDPPRLSAFERVLFEWARPGRIVLTTPNVEFNVRFEGLTPGRLRHPDHRFEWTRAEFARWAQRIAGAHGYRTRLAPIGPDDPEVGPPTQMAVFTR
jgi:3' terminal RNA ribose 2'-O-methyltransferase Hen1